MEPTHKLCCNQANRIFGLIKITCKGLNDPATLRTLYCSLGVAHFERASPQIAYKKFIRPLRSNCTSTLTGFDLVRCGSTWFVLSLERTLQEYYKYKLNFPRKIWRRDRINPHFPVYGL